MDPSIPPPAAPPAPASDADVSRRMSPGKTLVLPGQSPEGKYVLSVLLKRTYTIVPGGICTRALEDEKLHPGDVPWEDPMNSTVRFESDFVPFKPATDVILNGKAYAPRGTPVKSLTVLLQVGTVRKQVMVIGDRVARFVPGGIPRFTDPVPFTAMDLRYERAYGGIDVFSDKSTSYPYPRNPMGRGFVVANTQKSVENLQLPNLEDPAAPLNPRQLCLGEFARWEKQPFPAGLGWFHKTWYPRALLAGIMPADRALEQELRAAYAQLLPPDQRGPYLQHGLPDMNFRFFNGASPGLALPYLKGGEQVVTENLSPEGVLRFQLPADAPRLGLDIGSGPQEPPVVLHTVMIRMEERRVDMVWRGAVLYPGPDWLPRMQKMDVTVS